MTRTLNRWSGTVWQPRGRSSGAPPPAPPAEPVTPPPATTGGAGAPTALSTSQTATSATLNWAPPTTDGGNPITGYRVSRNGADTNGFGAYSTVTAATARSFTFLSMISGATYTLTVTAINSAGDGVAASRTVTIAAASLGVPTQVTTNQTISSATLMWQPPESDGGSPITGYRVSRDGTDSNGFGAYSTVTASTDRAFTMQALRAGATYNLSVSAITAVGESATVTRPVTITTTAAPAPTDPGATPPASGARSTAKPIGPADVTGMSWSTVFLDDFEGTTLDRTKWTESQGYMQGEIAATGGYAFDAFYPVPADQDKYGPGTRTIEVGTFHAASALKIKARRRAGVPSKDKWTTAQLFTHPDSHWSGGWLSPTTAGVKAEFYESRVYCQGGFGTSEQWWGLGLGQWPIGGEWDFMEMFNLDAGWLGIPHLSLHWPRDVYTNPPGTWLNDYHIGQGYRDPAGPLTLLNRWITIGTYRDANVIRGYVNGVQFVEFRRNQPFGTTPPSDPVPDVMFTGRMGLVVGLGVGGYQGSAKPEAEWQESDFYIDYTQMWVQT